MRILFSLFLVAPIIIYGAKLEVVSNNGVLVIYADGEAKEFKVKLNNTKQKVSFIGIENKEINSILNDFVSFDTKSKKLLEIAKKEKITIKKDGFHYRIKLEKHHQKIIDIVKFKKNDQGKLLYEYMLSLTWKFSFEGRSKLKEVLITYGEKKAKLTFD